MRLTFYSDYSLRLLMYAALKPDALITITGHARAGFARAVPHPSNRVCDALRISGEAERGVVRMLLNTLFWTTLGVVVVWLAS
jgi:hypothetical protein